MLPSYVELHCLSNFSFLRGASHPEELVQRAAELGYAGLAITDEGSLAGIVRAHLQARESDLPLLVGASFDLSDVSDPPDVSDRSRPRTRPTATVASSSSPATATATATSRN